jgi:hypothetical protein
MSLVHIDIEVEIPEGWSFVRWGVPEAGECYAGHNGMGVCIPCVDGQRDTRTKKACISKNAFKWFPWLGEGWICRDSYGIWWSEMAPSFVNRCNGRWASPGPMYEMMGLSAGNLPNPGLIGPKAIWEVNYGIDG